MLGRGANRSPARERNAEYGLRTDFPDLVRPSFDQLLMLVYSPHFGLGTNEAGNRNAPTISEANESVTRHALAKVRHHRLLVFTLLDAAIELRERDHRN